MPEIALNPPPFNPVWEKGVGGMRGKGAREYRTLLISPKNSTLARKGVSGRSRLSARRRRALPGTPTSWGRGHSRPQARRRRMQVRFCPSSPQPLPRKGRVFGRDEQCSVFPCAFAPHPPTPFSHTGRRGRLGVLMAETGDGTQGLAKKSTPVRKGVSGRSRLSARLRRALPGTPTPIQCSISIISANASASPAAIPERGLFRV